MCLELDINKPKWTFSIFLINQAQKLNDGMSMIYNTTKSLLMIIV